MRAKSLDKRTGGVAAVGGRKASRMKLTYIPAVEIDVSLQLRNLRRLDGFEKVFKLASGIWQRSYDGGGALDFCIVSNWIPVWFRVPFLSLQFWNEEMLSKIPLFVDAATSDMLRISYARIYVEIEASKEMLIWTCSKG
ncbi:hypothetical protein LIER_11103 [Lithospermum erythrorhizon]|uniref:DUF4283 domain-containing protein n=1 Tax=Lithospermum erythrorhizon TaxID=34254 RepID=A0AAV3PN75_LITER